MTDRPDYPTGLQLGYESHEITIGSVKGGLRLSSPFETTLGLGQTHPLTHLDTVETHTKILEYR